jgi:hypothetical protein
MAEFYVQRQAKDDKGHLVHDKDCSSIAKIEEFLYLGSYSTAEAAFNKAKGFYDPVRYCPNCLKR